MESIMGDEDKTFKQADIDRIVKERIDEITKQRDEARKEVTDLKSQVEDMTGKVDSYKALSEQAEKIKDELKEAKGAIETERATWEQDRQILRLGVSDDDVAELVKIKFSKQTDDGEKDFGKFLAAQQEETYLKPFLGQPSGDGDGGDGGGNGAEGNPPAAGDQPPRKDPASAGNPKSPPDPGNEFDPREIGKLTPEEFKKNEAEILTGIVAPGLE